MDREESAIRNNIKTLPASNNVLFEDAVRHLKEGRIEVAIKIGINLVNAGYEHANTLLGAAFEKKGDHSKLQEDYEAALFYYQRAVDKSGAVEGWLALGRFFYLGKGVQIDYSKAFGYYSTIVQDIDNGVAHLMLGKMYAEGQGTLQDLALARTHLEIAQRSGHVFAISCLGTVYYKEGRLLLGTWYRIKAGLAAILTMQRFSRTQTFRRI